MMHGLTNIKYYKHCECIRGIHCKNPFPVHKPKTWWSLISIQKWCDTVSKKHKYGIPSTGKKNLAP